MIALIVSITSVLKCFEEVYSDYSLSLRFDYVSIRFLAENLAQNGAIGR